MNTMVKYEQSHDYGKIFHEGADALARQLVLVDFCLLFSSVDINY